MRGGMTYEADYYERVEWTVPDILREALAICKGKRVLDVGCGIGVVGEVVFPGARCYLGLDVSQYAVDACRERGLAAICADATSPAAAHFFKRRDLVLAIEVLEHLPDPSLLLQRIGTVPQALVTVPREDDPTRHDDPTHVSLWTGWEWVDAFTSYGLVVRKEFSVSWGDQSVSHGWELERC